MDLSLLVAASCSAVLTCCGPCGTTTGEGSVKKNDYYAYVVKERGLDVAIDGNTLGAKSFPLNDDQLAALPCPSGADAAAFDDWSLAQRGGARSGDHTYTLEDDPHKSADPSLCTYIESSHYCPK